MDSNLNIKNLPLLFPVSDLTWDQFIYPRAGGGLGTSLNNTITTPGVKLLNYLRTSPSASNRFKDPIRGYCSITEAFCILSLSSTALHRNQSGEIDMKSPGMEV